MRFFVTGATGFVGSHVAKQLVEAGHEVVAVVRDPDKAGELAGLGAEVRRGDVTDKESMRGPMQGVDGVFHIAGWYKVGVKDKSGGERVNVQGTRNVLELMKELGVPKGVYTSTLAIHSDTRGKLADEAHRYDGSHLSEYDRTKAVAHRQIAEPMAAEGLPLVIVMPGLVYGPGDTSAVRTMLIRYLQRKLPGIPRTTAYSWGYVDDVACGHVLAMEKGTPGETYNLAGPTHTLAEALQMAQEITGIPAPKLMLPPGMLKATAAFMGQVERVTSVPDEYSSEYLRVIAGVTYTGSNDKARRKLGYNPRPLREGLAETLQHEMRLLGMPARA